MLKKKQVLLTTIILFMLLTSINLVKAPPSYYDVTLITAMRSTHPQFDQAQMDNGKFVYVMANSSADFIINVYSSSGTNEATTNYDAQVLSGELETYVISPIDANTLLIVYLSSDTFNTDWRTVALEYNTNTYAVTQTNGAIINEASDIDDSTTTEIIWYNDGTLSAYGIFYFQDAGVDPNAIAWEYTPSTDTLTQDAVEETPTLYGYTFSFFDSTSIEGSNWVYLISASEASLTTTIYAKWDLDNWTTEPEILATHPFATDWDYDNDLSLQFIDGDIFWSSTESDYIAYYWYTYTDSTYASVAVYCHRLRFNVTGIDADNLEAQSRMRDGVNIPNVANGQEVSHVGGYEVEKNYTVIWHSYLYTTPSTYRTAEIEFEITDFDDFASSSIDIANTRILEEDNFPNKDDDEFGYKDATSSFFATRNATATRIYYGLTVQAGTYDVTMTYTPADDPPRTLTRYQFWGVAYSGAFPVVIDYEWYIDDTLVDAGETGGQGQFFEYFTFSVAGIHTMTVTLYNEEGTEVYTEDFNYLFESVSEDTSEETIGITIGITMLVRYLPLLILIFAPAFLLYGTMKSIEGLLFGLGLGVAVAGMTGLLPIQYFFTLLVLIGVSIFYRSRGGSA